VLEAEHPEALPQQLAQPVHLAAEFGRKVFMNIPNCEEMTKMREEKDAVECTTRNQEKKMKNKEI
jgi:hypothetical protein